MDFNAVSNYRSHVHDLSNQLSGVGNKVSSVNLGPKSFGAVGQAFAGPAKDAVSHLGDQTHKVSGFVGQAGDNVDKMVKRSQQNESNVSDSFNKLDKGKGKLHDPSSRPSGPSHQPTQSSGSAHSPGHTAPSSTTPRGGAGGGTPKGAPGSAHSPGHTAPSSTTPRGGAGGGTPKGGPGSSSAPPTSPNKRPRNDSNAQPSSSTAPPPKKQKNSYEPGMHGGKQTEQKRLGDKYGYKVTGKTNQSEHPMGIDGMFTHSGMERGKGDAAKETENKMSAYQEATELHQAHVGTGTNRPNDNAGFRKEDRPGMPDGQPEASHLPTENYRRDQYNLVSSGRPGDAVQLNQLGYAHINGEHTPPSVNGVGHVNRPSDHPNHPYPEDDPNHPHRKAARDSYDQMIDNAKSQPYWDKDGNRHEAQWTPQQRAEAYLAYRARETGQYPTAEERAEARKRYGVDDDL